VVDKKYDTFEITATEASLFTAVKLSKEFKEASSQGFSILAGYIFGNKENENSHDFAQ
jgi:hypothetical protein